MFPRAPSPSLLIPSRTWLIEEERREAVCVRFSPFVETFPLLILVTEDISAMRRLSSHRLYNSTLSHGGLAVSAIKKYREVVALMEQSLESSSKANETINQAMKRVRSQSQKHSCSDEGQT